MILGGRFQGACPSDWTGTCLCYCAGTWLAVAWFVPHRRMNSFEDQVTFQPSELIQAR